MAIELPSWPQLNEDAVREFAGPVRTTGTPADLNPAS